MDVENKNIAIDNIMRWVLFGVLIVVAPPLFTCWFKIITGVNVNFVEYTPDMLLALLSVCCNLINTTIDSSKKVLRVLRWILGIILGIISIGCWGLFFVLRFNFKPIENDIARLLFYWTSGIIAGCTIIGIIIEGCSIGKVFKKQNKNVGRQ